MSACVWMGGGVCRSDQKGEELASPLCCPFTSGKTPAIVPKLPPLLSVLTNLLNFTHTISHFALNS